MSQENVDIVREGLASEVAPYPDAGYVTRRSAAPS
jgi:hypothetical protein